MKKKKFRGIFLLPVLLAIAMQASSQCEIINRIGVDGTMYYYVDTITFYSSATMSLKGTVVTDKESYFISLIPVPAPSRKLAERLKDSLDIMLSNNKRYKLEHFYSNFNKADSSVLLMFLISKDQLDDFRNNDVEEVKMNLGEKEGIRVYEFRLHKSAMRESLACFTKKKD